MLQKTFFASKGTKNLVEYPKPGRDFSTKSRKRSGERRSGAVPKTGPGLFNKESKTERGTTVRRGQPHARSTRKKAPGSVHRQADRQGKALRGARPTGAGNRGRGPEHAGTRPAIAPVRVAEENPARKKPRTRKSPARKRTPHGRNPARKEPRTEGTPHGRNPAQGKAPHKGKPRTNKKKSRTEGCLA